MDRKNADKFLVILRKVVGRAAKKNPQHKWSMTLAVLKNQLLHETNRSFDSKDYGAESLKELVLSLNPRMELVTVGGQPTVLFRDLSPTVDRTKVGSSQLSKQPVPIELGSGRIRDDLWVAVIDYSGGVSYVWDDNRGIARRAVGSEKLPLMPTLSQEEMDEWRTEFLSAEHIKSESDRSSAQRWRDNRLSTANLPQHLQYAWNKELNRRVRHRLALFFTGQEAARNHDDPKQDDDLAVTLDVDLEPALASGEYFVVGELSARSAEAASQRNPDAAVAMLIAAWSSSGSLPTRPTSIVDLSSRVETFDLDKVAIALVNAARRLRKSGIDVLSLTTDLNFKLHKNIASLFSIAEKRSPVDTCNAAALKVDEKLFELKSAVDFFLKSTPATAKAASIALLKLSHTIQPLLVSAERSYMRDLETLIGPAFRKLCEAYERNDDVAVLRRAPEFSDNIKRHTPAPSDARSYSVVWKDVIHPVLTHLTALVEEATSRGAVALAPNLKLRNSATKADLRALDRDVFLSFSVQNTGRGHAHDISLKCLSSNEIVTLVEPFGPFDVPPGSEQLVRLRLKAGQTEAPVRLGISWICQTPAGKSAEFSDEISVSQQVVEPNWELLISDPPYSLNPIKRPDRLYGRDTTLATLTLAAMSGASKFVWGQKRIGKTSLLQVLAATLANRPDTDPIILRMGELSSLHEGEIGRLIARRLIEISNVDVLIPAEAEFGAGIGRLVPFVEQLAAKAPGRKFVVIIDEFDDLDPAFYTGERGRQFVKALRSLSEVGLTFFFVGSERMGEIYRHHQADLNKWTNVYLDKIDSRTECSALIINPVLNVIEYSREAVDFIIDFCGGNPFYINNFCYQLFERCLHEHRTFVDGSDAGAVRYQLLRALGPTNFSHFWEDNPLLDAQERPMATAQNCVALTCLSILGGSYEDLDELHDVQDSLPLEAADKASRDDLREATARLIDRKIIIPMQENGKYLISLPIFREWLAENAVSNLIPIWRAYSEARRTASPDAISRIALVSEPPSSFIIPEDDLLAVSQRLVFCGRQKDVAEIRSWLVQFDDDTRIETAFSLLKRLTEKGFFNEGSKTLALAKLEEMIKARRLEVGSKTWRVERGRFDNLCITYVDSDIKSGSATARDLRNMLRPGKSGPARDVVPWMQSHSEQDPMVVLVDDFAGSGKTLAKGIASFKNAVPSKLWRTYSEQGRVSVFVMFAFPEALDLLRRTCPEIHAVAGTVLGDELRATSDDAMIFENEGELRFARDMLLQIGRELYPDAPLGFGDLGALVAFHNSVPNNTLPIFWSSGRPSRPWKPIFPRA